MLGDLRYGMRVLRRSPGFTAAATLTLALGVGANTAVFSIVNAVLLRPLPFREPDRLVMLWETRREGKDQVGLSPADFADWQRRSRSFERLAALSIATSGYVLTGRDQAVRLEGFPVTANTFLMLGVPPLMGRTFLPDEDRPGAEPVVVLSYGLWQRLFGADQRIIGQSLVLNGASHTVVGVMPPHFRFLDRDTELWVPLKFDAPTIQDRGWHFLRVFGRLKPGVRVAEVEAELGSIVQAIEREHPKEHSGYGVRVLTLRGAFVGTVRLALLVLLGAVTFVLLIACVNVANLMLGRAARRQREIGVRAALGASRSRLARQLTAESLLLAFLGGGLGLALAFWGVDLPVALFPESVAGPAAHVAADGIRVDATVLCFTLGLSVLGGLLVGLAPAIQVSRYDLNRLLKDGYGGTKRFGARSALVIAEVALALALLVGAGLLVRSFLRLHAVDPGFRSENVLTARVAPGSTDAKGTRLTAFYDEILRRVEQLPGVESAAAVVVLPGTGARWSMVFGAEGHPTVPGNQPTAIYRIVSPNYFRTLGIPLRRGRDLSPADTAGAPGVVIVSEALARKYWTVEDAVGKRLWLGGPQGSWLTIIGVAGDVRHQGLTVEAGPAIYRSYRQHSFPTLALVVRTGSEPLALAGSLRSVVAAVDKNQPVFEVQSPDQVLSEELAQPRFRTWLLGAFSAIALALAVVGVFSVMSYLVAQRAREIGIRMALGARRPDVLRLVIGQGMALVLAGIGLGLAGAWALSRFFATLLFGVEATDPTTYAGVACLVVVVALPAAWLPALRAASVDPVMTLRDQ